MAELTPEMIAQGIFLDSTGMPTLPDGTPVQNRGGLIEAIQQVQPPVDRRLEGTSAWLRVVREKRGTPA